MQKTDSDCLRFEELFYRPELTDEERVFCLEHTDACPLGLHTLEVLTRRDVDVLKAIVDIATEDDADPPGCPRLA